MLSATIAQIVTVNRSNHHVFQAHIGNGSGQVYRLIAIQRIGPAVADVAERAATGADVAHDHKGSGTTTEAFANIGAADFFADGKQLVLAQLFFDFVDLRRRR